MKIKIRLVSVVILIGMLSGCASVLGNRKQEELNKKIIRLEELALNKDARIRELENLLMNRGRQLSEKDAKIKELRSKLEMFGVFEQ